MNGAIHTPSTTRRSHDASGATALRSGGNRIRSRIGASMGLDNVNLLGAIAGAVGAMAIGSLWYSPWLFANRWQELIGKAPDEMGSPLVAMGIATLMFVLVGIGMSWVIPDGATIGIGLMWGFLVFWAFVLPAVVINGVFERAAWALMAIYLGYMLIASLVMAALITFLGG